MSEHGNLKRRTMGAIVWMVAATGWGSLASFATFAIQARLLDPFVFGVFNLAQILFQVTATLIVSGFNDTVIQRRDSTEDLLSTLFWSNLGLGCLASIAIFEGADFYARAVDVPDVATPLRWLALSLPLEVVSTIHLARGLRNFEHRVVAMRTFSSTVVGGGLAITAAWFGMGIWSLVLQAWVTSILNATLVWRAVPWIPQLSFSWRLLASVAPFCGTVMATKVLWLLLVRIPEIVIAHFWGAAAVGNYRVGWRLIELIGNTVLVPLGSVSMSTFSALSHDPQRLTSGYLRLLNVAAVVMFPLLFGCGYLAEDFVRILFGAKWIESAAIVQMLALMAIPQVLNCFIGPLLAAKGAMRSLTSVAVAQVSATLILSYLLAPFGPAAICGAYVARAYLTLPIQQMALYRSVGISFSTCLEYIKHPLLASAVMLGGLYALDKFFGFPAENHVASVAISVIFGAFLYLSTLFASDRTTVQSYVEFFSRRIRQGAGYGI